MPSIKPSIQARDLYVTLTEAVLPQYHTYLNIILSSFSFYRTGLDFLYKIIQINFTKTYAFPVP